MLEWTVCKSCGMILDNSQKSCLNCQGDVEKVNMDYLINYFDNLNFLLKHWIYLYLIVHQQRI